MTDKIVSLSGHRPRSKATRRLNPEKLRKARKARAMTQTELAETVGLTRQAISAFEQGSKSPEGATLVEIASVLDQPIAHFTTELPPAFGPLSARSYRAFGAATKRRNDQCDILTEWFSVTVSYLERFVNFPDVNIPEVPQPECDGAYSEEEIERSAEIVRSAWGLGLGPIGNLTKLLESRGVFIGHLPITTGKVNAFSYWCGARPLIITGTEDTTAVRRRFDLAHELGHLVLHQGIGQEELEVKDTLDRVESEANRFAGAFLLPRNSYPNEVLSTRLSSFIPLKDRWKVAISAQVYRCNDLELFSEKQVLNLRKQLSFNKWRTKEPLDDELSVETPTLLRKASLLAIESGTMDVSSAINELNLSPKVVAASMGLTADELLPESKGSGPKITLR